MSACDCMCWHGFRKAETLTGIVNSGSSSSGVKLAESAGTAAGPTAVAGAVAGAVVWAGA